MTISLCVPTRGRPFQFETMLASAERTAYGKFEVCAVLDEDDPTRLHYRSSPLVRYVTEPRVYQDGILTTSGLWSRAWEMATGDIAMLAADDIVFSTPGWDRMIEQEFTKVPDRILMVYGNDGTLKQLPVNPCVSREWIDAVGYFTPPDWQGWFSDHWIWSIAADLQRVVHLPKMVIEHVRPRRRAREAGSDQTYLDGAFAREQAGGFNAMYARFYSPALIAERDAQTARLRALCTSGPVPLPEPLPMWFVETRMKTMDWRA